jgi:hypothetical protein
MVTMTAYGYRVGCCGRNCISREKNTHTACHGINRHEKDQVVRSDQRGKAAITSRPAFEHGGRCAQSLGRLD